MGDDVKHGRQNVVGIPPAEIAEALAAENRRAVGGSNYWAREYADLFDRTERDRVELARLREGLQQIIDSNYPADAGNAETWAAEVLANPACVDWEEADA